MAKPFIKVKLVPKDAGRRLERILPEFQRRMAKEMKDFAKTSKQAVVDKIPVGRRRDHRRSVSTKRSIVVKSSFKKSNLRGVIKITGNEVLRFLDKGTRRSPGRYLPFLNRRVKTGFHPGIRPLNIIQEARNVIENDADNRIRKLRREFGFSIRKVFR